MGLMSRLFGIDDALRLMEVERKQTRAMMAEILRIASSQVDVLARMTSALSELQQFYHVDGPPEGRPHYNDEIEAVQWEKDHES